MNNIIAVLKRLQLKRILVVFLSGILLLVGVACSQPNAQAKSSSTSGDTEPISKNPKGSVYEGQNEGGMNKFSDVDPRRETTSAAESKAEKLINQSEKNLQKTEGPGDLGKVVRRESPVGQVKDAPERVGGTAEGFGEDVSESVPQQAENLKGNIQDIPGNLKKTVENVIGN